MEQLKLYIATSGESPSPALDSLDALLSRAPWFSAAQVVRERVTGQRWPVWEAVSDCRNVSQLGLKLVDSERLAVVTEGEIIDRFLRLSDYRIVADEEGVESDIAIEAELDEEDDLVSEELAEVYLLQGMKSEAVEIYRKLSLLNPEKSVYFAEKIENVENNK